MQLSYFYIFGTNQTFATFSGAWGSETIGSSERTFLFVCTVGSQNSIKVQVKKNLISTRVPRDRRESSELKRTFLSSVSGESQRTSGRVECYILHGQPSPTKCEAAGKQGLCTLDILSAIDKLQFLFKNEK